jgi:signal transduction histidine kinase
LPPLAPVLDLGSYRFGALGYLHFAGAAAVTAIVAAVVAGGGRERAARRAFAVNVGLVAFLMVAMGLARSAGSAPQNAAAARLALAAVAVIGPSTLSFICALVGWRRQLRAARALAWGAGATLAGLAVATRLVIAGAAPGGAGYLSQAGPALPFAMLLLGVTLGVALAICFGRARAATDPVLQHQLQAVLVAYAVGSLAALDALRLWHVPLPPTSFIWLTASVGILAVAIRSYQLLESPDLGWRALAWLGASALIAVPIVVFLRASDGWRGWSQPLVAAATLYLAFLALDAWARRVQPAIDDLFLRRRRDLEHKIDALGDRLLVAHTAEALAAEVGRVLGDALYVKLAALAVRDDDGGWRIAGSAWGSVPPPKADDPWLDALARRANPVTRAEALADKPGAARDAAARLFARYSAAVVVPLVAASQLGFIAVGERPDRKPFVPVELAFLRRLGALVATALAATRLYDRRHRVKTALLAQVATRAAEIEAARARLMAAQGRLVEGEKMATLGLVVGGVAAELEAAVDEVAAAVPGLGADIDLVDAAAARTLAAPGGAAVGEALHIDYIRGDVRAVLAAIAEGARRARAIAAGLRRFAGADAGERRVAVDLRVEIDAALTLVAGDLGDRIRVERDDAVDLASVLADPGPIGQVLANLLLNAIQAIDGAGSIAIRSRNLGDQVEVAVRDSGKGIPPEHLPRIFEPFFTTKELGAKGGTGLGLAISYGIVQALGGAFTVESTVGVGTEIRLTLPAAA